MPNPALPPGKENLPDAFHVYSMRQAIEEEFILDVLRNYISYGTAYKIAQQKAKSDAEDVLEAFKYYYRTAALSDVSDPNQVHFLFDKLGAQGIYQWSEVEQFTDVFFNKRKADMALTSICKPAKDRWCKRYAQARADIKEFAATLRQAKKSGDAVLLANEENKLKDAKASKDALDIFKKDLGTFNRFYEFISQIIVFDDRELEKLNLYARHLAPLLREEEEEPDQIDLSGVELTHYRLQKQQEQDLKLCEEAGKKLKPGTEFGSGSARNKEMEFLSRIIDRMNDLFAAEKLSEADLVSYARTIADRIQENEAVMSQVTNNNTPDQTMLGDFPAAVEEAVLASSDAHQELMTQFLSNKAIQLGFGKLILEMLSKSA